jgi:hypothetical protein
MSLDKQLELPGQTLINEELNKNEFWKEESKIEDKEVAL